MIALQPSPNARLAKAANDDGMAWPFIPFPTVGTPPAERAPQTSATRFHLVCAKGTTGTSPWAIMDHSSRTMLRGSWPRQTYSGARCADAPRNYGVSLRHAQPLGGPLELRRGHASANSFSSLRQFALGCRRLERLQAHPSENSFSLREDDPRVIEAQKHFAKITADASGSTTAT
jgi:hypothetical protein